jgi:hypothetical protein
VPSSKPATPGGLELTVEGSPEELAAFGRFLRAAGRFRPLQEGPVTEPIRGRRRQYLRLSFQITPTDTTEAPVVP